MNLSHSLFVPKTPFSLSLSPSSSTCATFSYLHTPAAPGGGTGFAGFPRKVEVFAQTHIGPVCDDAHDTRHDDHIRKRDPCRASRPTEVFVAVGRHV